MSEFSTLLPGDPLPSSVRVWNPILDAARSHREGQTPGLNSLEENVGRNPGNIILVHNTTSTDRPRGLYMKVLKPYLFGSENGDFRFYREVVYPAVANDERATSVVRLIETIPAGEVGRAQIVAPSSGTNPNLGQTRRSFAGDEIHCLPFLRCAEFDWVRFNMGAPLTSWQLNSGSGVGFTGLVCNSSNLASNSTYYPYLPYLRFSTTPGSALPHVYQGVQAYHIVRCFASIHSTFLITIPRRTIQSGGTTIGWAFDGVDCSMNGSPNVREVGQTIPPVYVPRMVTGVTGSSFGALTIQYSTDEPPATMAHVVVLVGPLRRYELMPNALIAGNWQFNRLSAYYTSSGFAITDPQPILIRCMSCLTSIIVYDVNDGQDPGGVINPPTTLGTEGMLASVSALGPDAQLQLSTGSVGGGGGVAVLPPSDIILARVSQPAAGEAAIATGPNATHNLTMGGV